MDSTEGKTHYADGESEATSKPWLRCRNASVSGVVTMVGLGEGTWLWPRTWPGLHRLGVGSEGWDLSPEVVYRAAAPRLRGP